MNYNTKHIVLITVFYLLQIIWFNHILLFGKYMPVVFLLPVLWLPLEKNEVTNLLLAFIYGISIDLVSNTGGVFAATSVTIVYLRKIYFFMVKNPMQDIEKFQINKIGFVQRAPYYLTFIFLGQIFVFLFESFHFPLVWHKLPYILVNTLITFIFFTLIDLLFLSTDKQ